MRNKRIIWEICDILFVVQVDMEASYLCNVGPWTDEPAKLACQQRVENIK